MQLFACVKRGRLKLEKEIYKKKKNDQKKFENQKKNEREAARAVVVADMRAAGVAPDKKTREALGRSNAGLARMRVALMNRWKKEGSDAAKCAVRALEVKLNR